uniref:Uncharacterized protein n=1 Tax=Cacopsylla melanoneura TaxID=428564 RepID=A0A8D9B3L9_9HEMI
MKRLSDSYHHTFCLIKFNNFEVRQQAFFRLAKTILLKTQNPGNNTLGASERREALKECSAAVVNGDMSGNNRRLQFWNRLGRYYLRTFRPRRGIIQQERRSMPPHVVLDKMTRKTPSASNVSRILGGRHMRPLSWQGNVQDFHNSVGNEYFQ